MGFDCIGTDSGLERGQELTDGVGTTYSRATYDQQGMLATWFPDRSLRVGDIVSRSERTGALTVQATLDEVTGGAHELPSLTATSGPERLVCQRGATIETAASTSITSVARAEVRFSGASSFIFAATQGEAMGYETLRSVRAVIHKLGSRGAWDPGWQLITHVRSFARCLVLISRGTGAAAEFSLTSATAGVGAIADNLDLSFGASITSGEAVKWELNECTPLYEALVLRRGTFVPDSVDDRYLGAPGDTDPNVVRAQPAELHLD
jgi:hypothetical protein